METHAFPVVKPRNEATPLNGFPIKNRVTAAVSCDSWNHPGVLQLMNQIAVKS
jgi:hypothetical protein